MVGSVTASDPDAGQGLGYAISAGNGGGAFAIDGSGGITVAGGMDHETTPQYVLTVTVSDDADPALSDEATVTIDVTDVNEAPSADDAVFSIAEEDAAIAAVVGSVTASDPDAGQTLGYAISAGDGGGAFAIEATAKSRWRRARITKRPRRYVLTVTVSDDADPALSDEATVTSTSPTSTRRRVPTTRSSDGGGSAIGAVVGSVTASDPDAGQRLGYAISAGNGGGAFAIDGSGGITVAGAWITKRPRSTC